MIMMFDDGVYNMFRNFISIKRGNCLVRSYVSPSYVSNTYDLVAKIEGAGLSGETGIPYLDLSYGGNSMFSIVVLI